MAKETPDERRAARHDATALHVTAYRDALPEAKTIDARAEIGHRCREGVRMAWGFRHTLPDDRELDGVLAENGIDLPSGLQAIYGAVWAHALRNGVTGIEYVWRGNGGMYTTMGGCFWRKTWEDGDTVRVINLVRDHYAPEDIDPPSDPRALLEELARLAHEYGHSQSDIAGTRDSVLGLSDDPAQIRHLTDQQKRDVMAEEQRAWRTGRDTLAALGVADFGWYDRCCEAALAIYRELFDPPTSTLTDGQGGQVRE